MVGKRPEYRLDGVRQSREAGGAGDLSRNESSISGEDTRQVDRVTGDEAEGPHVPLPLPPLPPPAQAGNIAQNEEDNEITLGAFVANDVLDEGVKIVCELRHGAVVDESAAGPGTRSRAPVKVICIARCPNGSHFATGSDDGVCRVWSDEEDATVHAIDLKLSASTRMVNAVSNESIRERSELLISFSGWLPFSV